MPGMNGKEEKTPQNNTESAQDAKNSDPKQQAPLETFPIVGIGASAGGLEALQEFFRNMPANSHMGFVVVTHQHPGHESILPEILARDTGMPVVKIQDRMRVEPDHIYVLGSGRSVTISQGELLFKKGGTAAPLSLPIDTFFLSLAEDMHERAVCILLSGNGSDGTRGMKEIKAQGGVALAQDLTSAKYTGMPGSALNTGLVDIVEPPKRMPRRLTEYMKGPYLRPKAGPAEGEEFPDEELNSVLRYIRSRTGHDFAMYKTSTIRRRIERRMSVHGLKKSRDYLDYLHENRQEARMLFSELLISVTSFFRDPDAFETLKNQYLPQLLASRAEDHEFRVWIPGCATGEEAYSIAIVLDEVRQAARRPFNIRIFGTDLDDQAIQRARHGTYQAGIAADVSPQRLERYFTRDGTDDWLVRKDLRDMLVFAQQNVLSDPPFVKLDLLVCRNVLIYLQPDLQKLLLPTFHYALNPGGILFLGSSESVGAYTELFEPLDVRCKIYRRRDIPTDLPRLPAKPGKAESMIQAEGNDERQLRPPQTNRLIERMLINLFAPVSIVIDTKGTILYIHGKTGAFLEPEEQQPRNNVFEMARAGLRLPLSAAVHHVLERNEDFAQSNLRVKSNGDYQLIDLGVRRIASPQSIRGLLLVTITPARSELLEPPAVKKSEAASKAPPERTEELERELLRVRESNQTMVEELQSTNEELQSANEELQSTNEELQSSKEEMESLNEELSTVNNELTSKVEALGQSRDDMKNLLNSTDLAVIFLDQQLRVKRYTEKAKSLVSLRDSDIGRPIGELVAKVQYDRLLDDCREVLDSLVRKELEMPTRDGSWLLLRILPYRTSENVIGGVVLTFIDISRLKIAERSAEAMEYFQSIVETVREPMIVLDASLRVQSANESFHRIFKTSGEQMLGKNLYELGNGQWNIPELRKLLEAVVPGNKSFNDYVVEHDFPAIGHKKFILNARRLQRAAGLPDFILLAMEESR